MSVAGSVTLYSVGIVVAALLGAAIPLLQRDTKQRVTFLAFAAGVMFGAAFFHMLPEALEGGGFKVLSVVPLGFVLMFLLERYVFVHACEEPPDCDEHTQHGTSLGLTAFFGLAAHTLFDGVALGSAATTGVAFTTFIAITAHKLPSSLSLASILKSEGRSARAVMFYALAFGCMVPLGAALYFVLQSVVSVETLAPRALAFSCGTFLYIAVSDLLPHINRHGREGRLRHIAGLVIGLAVMFFLSRVLHESHSVRGS